MDVAARAGVSKSTVSLVLQGSPQVRAETRQAVERAIAEIGYVYNRAAANLRSSSGGLVGLVVSDLRAPLCADFAASLQRALAAEGCATLVASCDEDAEAQATAVSAMLEHGASAMVIVPVHGDPGGSLDRLARARLPAMQALRRADERLDLFPFAGFDYATGSAKATRHLLEQGARRVAFVGGPPGRITTRERKSGWRDVLKRAGLDEVALHGKSGRAFGMDMAEVLMSDHPDVDAALCYNDAVALGLAEGFARAGRQVGRDMRIVGFGDTGEAALGRPPVSAISCDLSRLAADVAAQLLAWRAGGDRPPTESRCPVRLVARASSTGEGA